MVPNKFVQPASSYPTLFFYRVAWGFLNHEQHRSMTSVSYTLWKVDVLNPKNHVFFGKSFLWKKGCFFFRFQTEFSREYIILHPLSLKRNSRLGRVDSPWVAQGLSQYCWTAQCFMAPTWGAVLCFWGPLRFDIVGHQSLDGLSHQSFFLSPIWWVIASTLNMAFEWGI